jgi:hypothetical protein
VALSLLKTVVSSLPDEPRPKHEELRVKLLIRFYHHMEGKIKVPVNPKMVPALGAERVCEEQMESSFLHTG